MTSVDFRGLRPKKVCQDGRAGGGGGRCDGLRRRGVWNKSGGRFLPLEAAGGFKTMAGEYCRACAQYDPTVILGAKTLDC